MHSLKPRKHNENHILTVIRIINIIKKIIDFIKYKISNCETENCEFRNYLSNDNRIAAVLSAKRVKK